MRFSFKKLSNSVSFWVAIKYGGFVVLTTIVLLAYIYTQTIGALRAQYTRQITASTQRLNLAFIEGQNENLIRAIELTLSDHIDSEREIYLFLDEDGNKLAGNLDTLPNLPPGDIEAFDAPIMLEGNQSRGHLKVQELPGGRTLVVGHDLSEILAVSSRIKQASITAALAALALVGLGTYRLRRELEYRIGHIRLTTQQIGAGQLSKRIPPSFDDDQFTLLTHDINAMLDRIELLMKSARHISDTIAHNLRTPLTRITGRLHAAQRPGTSFCQIKAANQYAVDAIGSVNSLLEKILQIAEIEAGVQRQAFKVCELNVIALDIVDMYELIADSKGMSLTHSIFERTVVHGDINMLASVLSNLIDNAVKYTNTNIHVEVKRARGKWGCVIVQDDGPGIPPEEYEHIGKHFYRLDSTSEGYGLGLASVVGIVELHNGKLFFSDTQPGLKVTALFPLAPDTPDQKG